MKRRNFFRLLGIAPLAPYMLKKKKNDEPLLDYINKHGKPVKIATTYGDMYCRADNESISMRFNKKWRKVVFHNGSYIKLKRRNK